MDIQPVRTGTESRALSGVVVTPAELSAEQMAAMYALLADYFEHTSFAQFALDLHEKEWVVLLCERGMGSVKGFSTLMQLRVRVDDRPIVAYFSGDTIIDRAYWGEAELPRIWGRHVFTMADAVRDADVYWFLISSGYKTYRYLSVFFDVFYPSFRQPTPSHIQQIMDALGAAKFPDEYDAATGIIRFRHATPLRAGVAAVTPRRRKDPHVAYFLARNPNHADGEQLACLVKIDRGNVTPAGRRMLDA